MVFFICNPTDGMVAFWASSLTFRVVANIAKRSKTKLLMLKTTYFD
jgi:hypothetical protein